MLGLDQVAHLGADMDHGALGVLPADELVPATALLRGGDEGEEEPLHLADGLRDGDRLGKRAAQTARAAAGRAGAALRDGQLDAARLVQAAQGLLAGRDLQAAATVAEAELAADLAGERCARGQPSESEQNL